MRDIIRKHGLITVTSTECESACVLAFLGGNERYLAPGARLGFHTESFPGATPDETAAFEREDEQFMLSRGIPWDFVQRAFSTPSGDLWFPTTDDLKAANVITGESSDFAINEAAIDIKLLSWMEEIKRTYKLYRVLFQLHPEAEDELRNALKAIATKPKEEQEAAAQEASSAIVGKYFYPDVQKASDSSVYAYIEYSASLLESSTRQTGELHRVLQRHLF